MSFIAELRRRNVFKATAAYLVLGWIVLQAGGTIASVLRLPDWTSPLLFWIGLAGLPFVVVFSWVFELTPEGLQRTRDVDRSQSITPETGKRLDLVIIALLLVAIGLFATDRFLSHDSASASAPAPAPAEATAVGAGHARDFTVGPPVDRRAHGALPQQESTSEAPMSDDKSIAVLPFENRSDEQKDAHFVDGIHDDILTQLARIGALKVISRTSVEQYRDTRLGMKDIAQQLGVSTILEGAVQRAGDRVRINVQLIDADSDAHLWAETYDRELSTVNIFAIQSEVAAAIARALEATLTAGEQARVAVVPTQDLAAWESYQLGRQRLARRTSTALEESAQFFRKAIERDPDFALAHAGLADALVMRTVYSGVPLAATLAEADAVVGKALAIDPELAEAWVTAGTITLQRSEIERAESMFRRAIEIGPNSATAHFRYSWLLRDTGRTAEAMQNARRAADLDPLSAVVNADFAQTLEQAGHFDEAEARNRRAIEIDPLMPRPYFQLGILQAYAFNRYAEAIASVNRSIELDPGNPELLLNLALLFWSLGDDAAALRHLESNRQRWPDHPVTWAGVCIEHVIRGELRAARPEAERLLALNPRNDIGLTVQLIIDLQDAQPERAYARFAHAFPEFLAPDGPRIHAANRGFAVAFALLSQATGKPEQARVLLGLSERVIGTMPRLGVGGYGIDDVQIHALRGEREQALRALRAAERAGWRAVWRYHRDLIPTLDSIRDAPEFKAVFADIERDMAAQRARLLKE